MLQRGCFSASNMEKSPWALRTAVQTMEKVAENKKLYLYVELQMLDCFTVVDLICDQLLRPAVQCSHICAKRVDSKSP